MSNKQEVLARLDALQIPYEYYEHAPAMSMEDCLALPFADGETVFCKNILLCDRQQRAYYLYVLPPEKPFRTSVFSRQVGSSRLSFAPTDALETLLNLHSGSLSPLGLWFDQAKRVHLVFDRQVRSGAKIAFHPCDNSGTCVFEQEVFFGQVMPQLDHEPMWV